MPKQTILIDGGDQKPFFVAVDGGTLRVGDDPARPGGVVRGVRVVRIRCEVEVDGDGDPDTVRIGGADEAAPAWELGAGSAVTLGGARLSLAVTPPEATRPAAEPLRPAAPPAPPPPAGLSRRLVVIDGADRGHVFNLPAAGTVTIGKGTDINLDDLYVARTHCRLTVDGDGVVVTPVGGQNGTLIDGRRLEAPEFLHPGSVLRAGNSHLRLEAGAFDDEPPPAARPADTPAPADDKVIGHYRLGLTLGRGYTGTVYRATDVKTGQVVALKVFAGEFPASAAELERFSRAIREAQPVRHPNLLTPLGAGKAGPHCWIARELVDGESAADVIGRVAGGEKPSWTRAARVAVHLVRVLDCLHRHRLVHGNITPRNVLIRSADHATRLADLRLGQALAGSKLLTAVLEKKLLAELPYLAPEQAEPGAFVDESADLYAAGAVVYALITGRPPAAGKSPEEILDAVRSGRVTRPGVYYRKVPPAFEAVVMKLLARAQEDRYPSPAAVLGDLEPLVQAHGVER